MALPPSAEGGMRAALRTDFFMTSLGAFLVVRDGIQMLVVAEQCLCVTETVPYFVPTREFLQNAMARALLPAGIAAPPASSVSFVSADTKIIPMQHVTRPLLTALASLLTTVPAESSREALQSKWCILEDTETETETERASFICKELVEGFSQLQVTLPYQTCKDTSQDAACGTVVFWECAAGNHVSSECRKHSLQCLSCRGNVCTGCIVRMPSNDEVDDEEYPYTATEYCTKCAFWCGDCRSARLESERFRCAGPEPGKGLACTLSINVTLKDICLSCAKYRVEANNYVRPVTGFKCDTCHEKFCTNCRDHVGGCDSCDLSQCSNCAGSRSMSHCSQCSSYQCSKCDGMDAHYDYNVFAKQPKSGYGISMCSVCQGEFGANY